MVGCPRFMPSGIEGRLNTDNSSMETTPAQLRLARSFFLLAATGGKGRIYVWGPSEYNDLKWVVVCMTRGY